MERYPLRGGFVLAEAAAACVVVGVLAALLLVAAAESRRQSSLGDSLANLQRFAAVTAAYGADNTDQFWTFSWRAGVDYGFGGIASTDVQAAANQAVEIMRRRGNPAIVRITGWIPHLSYSQLALADYLDLTLVQRWWASPEATQLLQWQDDPATLPPGTNNLHLRFQSSYELGPAFYSPDALQDGVPTIAQAGYQHSLFFVGDSNTRLGTRRQSDVRLPGQKVHMYDHYQRHFGPSTPYFMYAEARVPLLMADGSAAVRNTSDANRGFNPNEPLSLNPQHVLYQPSPLEPPTLSGEASELVLGRYRWTRSGLRGRDFGGPEIPWSP
jgi:hypothetical protein